MNNGYTGLEGLAPGRLRLGLDPASKDVIERQYGLPSCQRERQPTDEPDSTDYDHIGVEARPLATFSTRSRACSTSSWFNFLRRARPTPMRWLRRAALRS